MSLATISPSLELLTGKMRSAEIKRGVGAVFRAVCFGSTGTGIQRPPGKPPLWLD